MVWSIRVLAISSSLYVCSVNNLVHIQGTPMNTNIPVAVRHASGVRTGHIQPRHYSSEGED